MIINRENLDTLASGFQDAFTRGLTAAQARTRIEDVAVELDSMTAQEVYAWLKQFPQMREWLGERVIHNVEQEGQVVRNRDYELAIGVDRNHIEDDKYGVYGQLFAGMGSSVSGHLAELVFGSLKDGFDQPCYDGQNFFDTDHPVAGGTASNAGFPSDRNNDMTPWFLCDLGMSFTRPIILQMRKRADRIVRRDRDEDANVFDRKEYLYGVDGRYATAYGFWQGSYGATVELNAANFKAGFAAIEGQKGDQGRPLGLSPTHLIVPPSLREAGMKLVNANLVDQGASNVWSGSVELIVSPWLA
ncbi:MAG: hypothetical protein F4160_14540 [Rhodospirillaceae bacterium]|nr:hypothetical protein [Rhodospirillaceae bacterium]